MSNKRLYTPIRPDSNFEYKIGLTFDCVFYVIVLGIIVKLYLILGH